MTTKRTTQVPRRGGWWLVVAVALLMMLAIWGLWPSSARVSGRVTRAGKPATTGIVTFATADGRLWAGVIRTDGHYEVSGLPTGPAQIGVTTTPPTTGRANSRNRSKNTQRTLAPDSFIDPDTSGLRVTLAVGENTRDIDIP